MKNSYAYAVARIRALEVSLFSNGTVEQLISIPDYESCLNFLEEKGWGGSEDEGSGEDILATEESKIWQVVKELNIDMDNFEVLALPGRFHNLKAAIKESVTGKEGLNIYYESGSPSGEEIKNIISQKDFAALPDNMSKIAEEAYERMLHTGDGQLCDLLIDRACLNAVYRAGKDSGVDIIKNYAESVVAVADIKIAVRSHKTGKTIDFMEAAMAPCHSLSVDRLAKAALAGEEAIIDYLDQTIYAEGGAALAESSSAFERWCDNRIINTIKSEKYNAFTIGPVIAYVIARQNEIKTVRIILSAKQSGLPEESVRERVREMYV